MIALLNTVGDAMLAPFAWLPPAAAVVALSVACGLLLLLAFGALTPSSRLRRVKERMSATIYEMRLFGAYPGRVARAQGRAILLTGHYLVLALPALLVLFPPVGLLAARAATRWEYRPLRPGETALLTVTLAPEAAGDRAEIAVSAAGRGVKVRPPVVRVPERHQAVVRLKALQPGVHRVVVSVGDARVDKTVTVGPRQPVSAVRAAGSKWAGLVGREDPLAAGGAVQALALDYPSDPVRWLGLPWYVVFLIISIVTALALRNRLGVVF